MTESTLALDADGTQPSPQPKVLSTEAQKAVDKFAADLKWGLLKPLFYRSEPAAEPACDLCSKPITHEQFAHSAATLDWRSRRWRITHNACEPNVQDGSGVSCFEYWVGLDMLETPQAALGHTLHMMGHTRGFPRWKSDVIDRLYPTGELKTRGAA